MSQKTVELPCSTLYFRQGSSNKVYQVAIRPGPSGDDRFVVTFAFGRRGGPLQTGSKTPAPVPLAQARRIFDALVREKAAKGYTLGEDGTPFQQTGNAERATGLVPQLCNPVSEHDVDRLLVDDNWWMQEKFDGRRMLLRRRGEQVSGVNRRGLLLDGLPRPLVQAVLKLPAEDVLLDGEAMGDRFVAFDLLSAGDQDLRTKAYYKRYERLLDLVDAVDADELRFAPVAANGSQKSAMLARLRSAKAEGVVFKRAGARYTPGRPASGGDWLKFKFLATASCIVAGSNRARRSVRLELIAGEERVGIGSVTIPANQKVPATGAVVEVRYLYAYPGGSLFQPVYLGQRDDIEIQACDAAQLKLKSENPADDSTDEPAQAA